MLHIKFDAKGKVVYAYQHQTGEKQNNIDMLIPRPIVPNIICKRKIKIDDWYLEHSKKIDEITCIYMDALIEFLTLNSHYLCQVNEVELKKSIINTLYNCSHNSFKSYLSA
jgi:hypothetical protein